MQEAVATRFVILNKDKPEVIDWDLQRINNPENEGKIDPAYAAAVKRYSDGNVPYVDRRRIKDTITALFARIAAQ